MSRHDVIMWQKYTLFIDEKYMSVPNIFVLFSLGLTFPK